MAKNIVKARLPAGRQGYTLMELLVVISIIAILVAIATVSYASAQKTARDTRRVNDMKSIQNAWEQYYADNNASYPATCTISATYLPGGIPTEPMSGTSYATIANDNWSTCAAASYCFCAGVENVKNGNSDNDCEGNTSDIVATITYTDFYCIRNLQ